MRIVVVDRWHTSQYLMSIDWITMEKGYDIVRPESLNAPRLKSLHMMYVKASDMYFTKSIKYYEKDVKQDF